MSSNLSINLNKGGGGSLSKPQTSAHAQDFSTSKLQQRKDRESAHTSMDKAAKGSSYSPVSSFSRIGQNKNSIASTSVSHAGRGVMQDDDDATREEIRDRLRQKHIRQMMKDKKEQESKN